LIERIRKNNVVSFSNLQSLNIGIGSEREETRRRITERLKQRLAAGMIEEVEELLQKGVSFEKLNFFGLEYKYVSQYVEGKLNYNDMFQKLNSAIHNFAKRQMTWFRKMKKEDVKINWFPPDYPAIKDFIISQLNNAKNVS
jgi:tRNA dimethylallyltransferase